MVGRLHDKPLPEIIKEVEKPLKGTYSFKIMGVKDGEFGIMSKRLELKKF
jgi:hypothetical protein